MSVKVQKSKSSSPKRAGTPAAAVPAPRTSGWWLWVGGFTAALIAALFAYAPALRGQFVFDDAHMPFASPHPEAIPFRLWLIGARPLIGLSYWLNFRMDGTYPLGYHVTNVFLHTITALFVFLIVRKILEFAAPTTSDRRRTIVALFCAGIFLLHPIQTEAVAYISGRSESLSVAFAFAAWTCFLYRPGRAAGWGTVAGVLLLCACAVTAKEHVAVLPVVILLTDYYWNPGFSLEGVRRNWRLYASFLVGGALMGAFLYSYLSTASTIGFNLKQFTWYQYLFTQFRVLFVYLRLFLLPFGQRADYALEPSRTLLDHGAIFGMAALSVALVAAFLWRKRFPLASFGLFVAIIFLLPTSSIVPIRDLVAERRLYLPMIGLLLIAAEFLVRWRADETRFAGLLAMVVLCAGVVTWNRSHVWSSQVALWTDTVEKSPNDARAHLGLASAYYGIHRFNDAAREYELAKNFGTLADGLFYSSWATSLEGAGRLKEAIDMGNKAVSLNPTASVCAVQGKLLAMDGDVQQALALLDKAEKADPYYEPTFIERGVILMTIGRRDAACEAFGHARNLDPTDQSADKGLVTLGCGKSQ